MKILLVEDEEMLNGITAKYLRAENMTVDTCFNGQQAIDYVNTSSYDVIVMDIMMPILDGISALAQMRNDGNTTPVLLLTAKEFDLLYYLASNENIVLSRQQILDHVWEYDYESYSNLIDVYIKDLRKKIDTDENVKLIQTVRGVGYVLKTEN